jgi:fructoselysine 6-kinase
VTDAVCVGDNTIDRYVAPVARELVGGSCVNVAVHLASRGVSSAYVGPVGDDAAGRAIVAELAAHDVDVSRVAVADGAETAVTEIELLPDGDRRFLRETYGIFDGYEPDDVAWQLVTAARHVHTSRLERVLERLVRDRPDAAYTVSCDFSVWDPPADLRGVDVAFRSAHGADEPKLAEVAEETRARGARIVVVTAGAAGSLAASAAGIGRQPALPVDVVDTTGAGDAFIAAFLERWLDDSPIDDCLAAGARAGADACTSVGAFPQRRAA